MRNNEADTQRLRSSLGTSSSSFSKQEQSFLMKQLDLPKLDVPQYRGHIPQHSPNLGAENGSKKAGIPPISPYSQSPFNRPGLQNFGNGPGPSHGRSLSQPSFFALDSLPPLSPSPYKEPHPNSTSNKALIDVSTEERDGKSHSLLPPSPFTRGGAIRIGESLPLPPRKAHRRSNSDIPFGFASFMQSPPPLMPLRNHGALDNSVSARENSVAQLVHSVKKESKWEKGGKSNGEANGERKPVREMADDLFNTYMNLENIDTFNSFSSDEKPGTKNHEDLDSSKASGTMTNGGDSSDNESVSSIQKREGLKRNAVGDIAPTNRHYRSVSMDSLMGKMNFGDESSKVPPSLGAFPDQLSPTNSLDANQNAFSLEFGNGEFSAAELKKIMANEKLTEIALNDPKRAKRILANRQSASRSKERKMRYMAELEHKVQTLQTEATALSAQLTLLQQDSARLTSQNNELKFRLQALDQQAELRDALNEALTVELQRLKLAMTDISRDTF